MISSRSQVAGAEQTAEIQSLSIGKAVLLFAIPAFAFRASVYTGTPWLIAQGVSQFHAFLLSFIVPLAALLAAALLAYRWEGHSWTWAAFATRMRLTWPRRHDWVITAFGFVIGFFGSGLLIATSPLIARLPMFAPPAHLPPMLNPLTVKQLIPADFLGAPLAGNWSIIGLYLVLLAFNIIGEELWWRGYILPRQERTHGQSAWLIHGILWTLFHVPLYPWNILALLPTCLTLSYVAQRTRSTWPGIVTHLLTNGLAMVPLVLGVLAL